MFELTKDTLKKTLEILKINDMIMPSDIDGLLVKKMAMSNILKKNRPTGDNGKQTHIAITSKERSLFPMVSSVTYYDKSEDIKFYDLKLPVTLIKSNIEPLDERKLIKFEGEFKETFTICYIRKDGENFQVQLSKLKNDDKDFIDFRGLISEEDYLCIIKKKNEFKFYFLILKKDLKDNFLEEFNSNENLLYLDKTGLTEVSKGDILEDSELKSFFISDDNILILAIYLSKFSEKAYKYMGFKNWAETYSNIAKRSKGYNKSNSINNLRDQFDPKFDNGRAGWHQTELSPKYQNMYEYYKDYNEEEFRSIFNKIWGGFENTIRVSETSENYEVSKKINQPHNRIIYGAPGTGKSFKLDKETKDRFKKNIIKEKNNLELIDDGSNPNYWIVTCGKDNIYWGEFQREGIFAIGWDQLGDLKQDTTEDIMLKRLKEINGGNYEIKNQWRISHLMKKGDIIGVRKGIKDKQVVGYGIIGGNYKFDESREFFKQTIPVEWKSIEDIKLDKYSKQFPMQSIVEMNNELKIIFKRDYLKEEIQTEIEEIEISTLDRVTFYDGYTHGQFVGIYKPVPEGDSITYKYIPGPFIKQLVESYKNPEHNFCLIIEEINRAKADKVFGNIFQLLDRDSDGKSEYHIAVSADQETYLKKELEDEYNDTLEKLLNEGLYIPNNLYIWATMNSSDQGVYPMDSAFKRRWNFEHIGLDDNEDQFGEEGKTFGLTYQKEKDAGKMEKKIIPWNDFRKIINKNLLGDNVSEDRLLAPFFIKENNFQMKEEESYELDEKVFKNKILMYLFDDVLRHKKKTILFDENIQSFSQLKTAWEDGKVIFHSAVIEKLETKKLMEESIVENISEEA